MGEPGFEAAPLAGADGTWDTSLGRGGGRGGPTLAPAFLCIFPKSRIKKCAFVSYFVDFEKLIFLKLEKLYFK